MRFIEKSYASIFGANSLNININIAAVVVFCPSDEIIPKPNVLSVQIFVFNYIRILHDILDEYSLKIIIW